MHVLDTHSSDLWNVFRVFLQADDLFVFKEAAVVLQVQRQALAVLALVRVGGWLASAEQRDASQAPQRQSSNDTGSEYVPACILTTQV